jgi:hypothetical protein
MNIDAKQAARIATKYYEEILQEPAELSIEEIELNEEGFWLITLGRSDYGFGIKKANYKIFKIDANTSEVKSMKIRTIK